MDRRRRLHGEVPQTHPTHGHVAHKPSVPSLLSVAPKVRRAWGRSLFTEESPPHPFGTAQLSLSLRSKRRIQSLWALPGAQGISKPRGPLVGSPQALGLVSRAACGGSRFAGWQLAAGVCLGLAVPPNAHFTSR